LRHPTRSPIGVILPIGTGDIGEPLRQELPSPRDVEGLRQQRREVVHDHVAAAQEGGERVVLLAGTLGPQHVLEEEFVHRGRGEALELQARPVQHHAAQLTHLGVDAESTHAGHHPPAL
jgi:hypothetical protein